MKFESILKSKYPEQSDMHRKIESTRVCMTYNQLMKDTFPMLSFSEAISLSQGTLAVITKSHLEAHQVKLYEYDILEKLNQTIDLSDFEVKRIYIRTQ
jgi:hypothetical protein